MKEQHDDHHHRHDPPAIDWDLPTVHNLCRPFDDAFSALATLGEFAGDIELACDGLHPVAPTREQCAEWLRVRREVAENITAMAGSCCTSADDRVRVERHMRDIVDIITNVSTAAGAYYNAHRAFHLQPSS